MPDNHPDPTAPSDIDEVSNVPVPEQPPMLDEDDEETAGTSTDDLSVQGGE